MVGIDPCLPPLPLPPLPLCLLLPPPLPLLHVRSDPKSYRKGEKFLVELKDNPYVQLAEEKPERKYVASGLRRAP